MNLFRYFCIAIILVEAVDGASQDVILAGVLQRPHSQVEDITCHLALLWHRVEAAELNRLDALDVLQPVEVALVDAAFEQVAGVAEDLLSCGPLIFLGEWHDLVTLVRLDHLKELLVTLFHFGVVVEELLRLLLLLLSAIVIRYIRAILGVVLARLALASASRCDALFDCWALRDE